MIIAAKSGSSILQIAVMGGLLTAEFPRKHRASLAESSGGCQTMCCFPGEPIPTSPENALASLL
jgi:hypothetical protein